MELVFSTPKPKLTTVLRETRRLIKSLPRRFIAIFFASLFLLTISLRLITFFTVPNGNVASNPFTAKTIVTLLIFLVSKLFVLSVTAAITSVAFRSFRGEPIGLKSIAKSVSASALYLVATDLLKYVIFFAVTFFFSLLFVLATFASVSLGFQVEPDSPYFQGLLYGVLVGPSALTIAYLIVTWALYIPVVVAESKWGFEALKRSASLVKGRRFVAFGLMLIFYVFMCLFDWISQYSRRPEGGLGDKNKEAVSVALLFVAGSSWTVSVQIYEIVATTLFYVFCKAVHEEVDFSGDGHHQYVKLAADDFEKVVKVSGC